MSTLGQAKAYAANARTRIEERACRCARCIDAIQADKLAAVLRILAVHRQAAPQNIFAPRPKRITIVRRRAEPCAVEQ